MNYSLHFSHRRAPDLDGTRGVLAFCVVLLHFGFNSFITRTSGGESSGAIFQLCVDAFFILSGFVLTISLSKSTPSFSGFARKRFYRLAPIFYLTTLIALAFRPPGYDWRYLPLEAIGALPALNRDPANFPSWSASWEFYLPLAAYFVGRWLPRLSRSENRVALVCALIALGLFETHILVGQSLYLPRAALGLVSGHLLYRSHLRHLFNWRAWMTPSLLAVLLALMFVAGFNADTAVVFPIVVCCLVLSGASNQSWLLSSRPAQWLGSISYTLYMVHVPVLLIGTELFGHWFAHNPIAKLVGVGASLASAAMLTRYIELPMIDYAKRTAKVSPKAPAMPFRAKPPA